MEPERRSHAFHCCSMSLLPLLLLMLTSSGSSVEAAPEQPTDSFLSPCAFLADVQTGITPPRVVFRSWKNSSTWPNGIVPTGGVNVTIPCGVAIELDVGSVEVGLLRIQGLLRFMDDPSLPRILLKANYILVEGQLIIGRPDRSFGQKAIIELTPNTAGGRSPLLFTSTPPADPRNPRTLGHKAFAVVGGQVHLHGMPGGPNTPSWCRLSKTAIYDEDTITVDAVGAASWPINGEIVVASTDYSMEQTEVFNIISVRNVTGGAIIGLSQPLNYIHHGNCYGLTDGFGGFVHQRAEVALLTRNIVIMGTDEPDPYQYEGGHFIIFMTQTPAQHIVGVEFTKMGQQGQLGRYPIHFHLVGSNPNTICRKNSIHRCKQRCLVVHASFNMTIDSNVAYESRGHCFIVEEGGESGNTFSNNLGMVARTGQNRINADKDWDAVALSHWSVVKKISPDETDDTPSIFWISNVRNTYIGNVAAGSEDSGFWIELRDSVRGLSKNFGLVNETVPFFQSILKFEDNVAHSTAFAGFRTYPNGIMPRVDNDWDQLGPKDGSINGLNLYKNAYMGMFVHQTEFLTINNATFADNYWGLYLNKDHSVKLSSSRVVGLTENYGNPDGCWSDDLWTTCRPVYTCKMPLRWGFPGRSTGGALRTAPIFGVLIDLYTNDQFDSNNIPNQIVSTIFHGFNSTCWQAAAIVMIGDGGFWLPSHRVKGLRFSSSTNAIWAPPRMYSTAPWGGIDDGGEQSQFYTLWDTDGSIIGAPGYVVANNTAILPPKKNNCTFIPKWNAYGCINSCYRTIRVNYIEPRFKSSSDANVRGNYSYLQVTRVEDGQVITLAGNVRNVNNDSLGDGFRIFSMTLLAGMTYRIAIIPSMETPNFFPSNVTLSYMDYEGCGNGLTVQMMSQANKFWKIVKNPDSVFFKKCQGTEVLSANMSYATYSYPCVNKTAWMAIKFGPIFYENVLLTSTSGSTACKLTSQCSTIWYGSSRWLYDASGLERRPDFYNPQGSTVGWNLGAAPLAYNWDDSEYKTLLPAPSALLKTYYFRQKFSLTNTICYSSLLLEIIVQDGVVVYLNNQEILRSNMPTGLISNATEALETIDLSSARKSFTVPLPGPKSSYYLVEGVNFIAVEQHVAYEDTWQTAFDMRISLIRTQDNCTGAFISPEICDGVDNNNNGKIDEAANGQPLTRTCKTACGTGIETCIKGIFQRCTAPPANPEICNGVDDNCDGLIDNGRRTLNCVGGRVCLNGTCLLMRNATVPVQLWPKNVTGWSYYDKGGNLDSINPNWRNGTKTDTWKKGQGPLGFNYIPSQQKWDKFGTVLNNFGSDDVSVTAYFAKPFTLTKADIYSIFSIDFNARRVEGLVVYLNGGEIWRSNMPWKKITYTTTALESMGDQEWEPGTNCCNLQWNYNKCESCFHNTTSLLKVGVNYITAELHMAWTGEDHAAFDMDLWKNVLVPCNTLPGNPATCVRQVKQEALPEQSTWSFSDGSLTLPSSNWTSPSFVATKWKSGRAPIGFGSDLQWLVNTNLSSGPKKNDPQRTYFFRKTIQVPDGSCYFEWNSTILANDGAVVYINGLEAYRYNMDPGPLNYSSFASQSGDWERHSQLVSGGWLKKGTNLIAVELHRAEDSTENIFFDLQLVGSREAVTCSPAPL